MNKKFLFIDDDKEFLEELEEYLNNPNVVFAECHSTDDALKAIEKSSPNVIFLDHHLTKDDEGNEGLKIAYMLVRRKDIKIYSTTRDISVLSKYQNLGIENVNKFDMERIESIIRQG